MKPMITGTNTARAMGLWVVTFGAMAIFHTAAFAQQDPLPNEQVPSVPSTAPANPQSDAGSPQAPAANTAPAPPVPAPPAGAPPYPYGPPPGYGPPPRYRHHYPPAYYPPPAAMHRRSDYRPFSLSGGLGAGGLSFLDIAGRENAAGLSYTARLSFGVVHHWSVFIGLEGTAAHFREQALAQTAMMVGPQLSLLDNRLYLRAGVGFANRSADDGFYYDTDHRGLAFMGSVGFEFAQGFSTALAVEIATTIARYPGETWTNSGLNLVLHFY